MIARYETRVYPRGRTAEVGIPVVVYAESRQAAVDTAVQIGASGPASDAHVMVLSVTQEKPE